MQAELVNAGKCQNCGRTVERFASSGKYPKWCSPECRQGVHEVECVECGTRFTARTRSASTCSAKCRQQYRHRKAGTLRHIDGHVCQNPECRKRFFPKWTGSRTTFKYCSKKCAAAVNRGGNLGFNDKWKNAISDGYLWWAHSFKACAFCGDVHQLSPMQVKCGWRFCGFNCAGHFKAGIYRRCERCGGEIDRRKELRVRNCKPCRQENERIQRAKQKASREVGAINGDEDVDPVAVFKRDRWKCQICLGPCTPVFNPNDMACATLDHIVPRSIGGTHSYDNLQTAHLICNSYKCDG